MFYKPEYCCSCSQKIEGKTRRLWNSTRFCEACRDDFKLVEWTPRIVIFICVLFGLFGFGNLLLKEEKPLNLTSRQVVENSVETKKNTKGKENAVQPSNDVNVQPANNSINKTTVESRNQPAETQVQSQKLIRLKAENQISGDDDPTYFCGAETKKGTPCSRRVKGGGRCWQHQGQKALLPAEKLLAGK